MTNLSWLLSGIFPAILFVAQRREWFLFRVNFNHVVDTSRDGDRFNKSLRDQALFDGDRAIAVTVLYVGPRPVTIIDIDWALLTRRFWSHHKASERTIQPYHFERWLIPLRHFETRNVTSIFLTKDDQTRQVARVNYPTRLWLWHSNRKFRRIAKRLQTQSQSQ